MYGKYCCLWQPTGLFGSIWKNFYLRFSPVGCHKQQYLPYIATCYHQRPYIAIYCHISLVPCFAQFMAYSRLHSTRICVYWCCNAHMCVIKAPEKGRCLFSIRIFMCKYLNFWRSKACSFGHSKTVPWQSLTVCKALILEVVCISPHWRICIHKFCLKLPKIRHVSRCWQPRSVWEQGIVTFSQASCPIRPVMGVSYWSVRKNFSKSWKSHR